MNGNKQIIATALAALLVLSAVGAAVQPAAGASDVQRPSEVFSDSVLKNTDWIGRWSPSEDVVRYGLEDRPGWVVELENNSSSSLQAWASASSERAIQHWNNDSNLAVVSAPANHVGIGFTLFGEQLRRESYVVRIGVETRTKVDPIRTPGLKTASEWEQPRGAWWVEKPFSGNEFTSEGVAFKDDVNTSTLDEAREAIGADQVSSADGTGVKVAILDTGLNYDSDLYGDRVVDGKNVLTGETLNTTKSAENRSYDPIADGSSSRHGSWVATAIAGNGSGPNATGVAPNASLVPVKVLADDGSGSTTDVAEGLEWACEEANADVVSMSLGSPMSSMQIGYEIRECLEDEGVSAVVVAGGNNRMTYRYLASPGDEEPVITVAASDSRAINESESAYFSAVGPDPETGKHPDLAAPGLKVTAETAERNQTLSGTSMATPLVTGTAALAIDADPSLRGEPDQLRTYLIERAEPMPRAGTTEVGDGRVSATNVVEDTVPEEDQETSRDDTARSRDGANNALSGSWLQPAQRSAG